MEIIYLLLSFVIGIITTVFVKRIIPSKTSIDLDNEKKKNEELNKKLSDKQIKLENRIGEIGGLTTKNENLTKELELQKKEGERLNVNLKTEFKNIANEILQEKTERFTKQNKENLDTILNPLKENIGKFEKQVSEAYINESKERSSLGDKVKELVELNKKLSDEANNLTKALKGEAKTQGNWGEMILERILEQSGLTKGREYFVQDFLRDEDGNTLKNDFGKKMQPDIVVTYPGNRKIIIDSKTSLTAYTEYCGTDDPDEQQRFLENHLNSIYNHINDLSSKSYQDFVPTLDFVMMFVPNEAAYILALQSDTNLWNEAYKKRIILISPTNLIAALKLIVDLWEREKQNQNVKEIVKRGAELYDKFVGFVDNLSKIGDTLEKAQSTYDITFKQLKSGKGNLIGRANKLKELGVNSKKSLPNHLVTDALIEENQNDVKEEI